MIAVDEARNDPRTRSFDRDYLSVENVHAMLDAPIFDGERLSGLANMDSLRDRLAHLVRKMKTRGTGLMAELGACVLSRVCAYWRDARDRNLRLPTISVNLSAEQVMMPELPARVRAICDHHQMPVRSLQFEVTEDSIQGEAETISRVLSELVDAGAELAIDDFGTGYSSLARLKTLPFSRIKIDRSFINNLPDDENDCAITLSIIGLARGLGLSVVAEGVEEEAHERWLVDQGCDFLQGYRYSKPLPFDELISRYFSH